MDGPEGELCGEKGVLEFRERYWRTGRLCLDGPARWRWWGRMNGEALGTR